MSDKADDALHPEYVQMMEKAQAEIADVLSALSGVGQMAWNHKPPTVERHAQLMATVATALGQAEMALARSHADDADGTE